MESSVVDEAPRPRAASGSAAGRGQATAPRPAASPPLFDGVPLTVPGGLPGLPGLPGAMPSPKEGKTDPAVVPTGGRFVERSYTDRAGTRAYKLYIPSGYVAQAVPLVVMLHGCHSEPR